MISAPWILALMLDAATAEPPSRFLPTYAETAAEIADASGDDATLAAVLVAIAWHESRFDRDALGDCGGKPKSVANCKSRGPFQSTPPSAADAARLVTISRRLTPSHPLAWYACGRRPPFAPSCDRASDTRTKLAARLLAAHPPPPAEDAP